MSIETIEDFNHYINTMRQELFNEVRGQVDNEDTEFPYDTLLELANEYTSNCEYANSYSKAFDLVALLRLEGEDVLNAGMDHFNDIGDIFDSFDKMVCAIAYSCIIEALVEYDVASEFIDSLYEETWDADQPIKEDPDYEEEDESSEEE